jgi:hypothetical protein
MWTTSLSAVGTVDAEAEAATGLADEVATAGGALARGSLQAVMAIKTMTISGLTPAASPPSPP